MAILDRTESSVGLALQRCVMGASLWLLGAEISTYGKINRQQGLESQQRLGIARATEHLSPNSTLIWGVDRRGCTSLPRNLCDN